MAQLAAWHGQGLCAPPSDKHCKASEWISVWHEIMSNRLICCGPVCYLINANDTQEIIDVVMFRHWALSWSRGGLTSLQGNTPPHIGGLVRHSGGSSALAAELLRSRSKPSISSITTISFCHNNTTVKHICLLNVVAPNDIVLHCEIIYT